MPRLSGWFIRASLVYLALGFSLGSLMLANEGLTINPSLGRFLPVHMEFLIIGWLFQLALGVAYWILPRNATGAPRGNEALAWSSLICINAGILSVAFSACFITDWIGFMGRILEALAILIFLLGAWRRVRSSR